MIEERFESYVYQIMKYVKYQENKPYIESILEEMRYTLFREDRNYIKQLEQENKQLKENYEKIYNENCKLRENHNINDISLLDENEQLKERIKHADEFCDRYMGVNLELFDMYELLNKIRVILGSDKK